MKTSTSKTPRLDQAERSIAAMAAMIAARGIRRRATATPTTGKDGDSAAPAAPGPTVQGRPPFIVGWPRGRMSPETAAAMMRGALPSDARPVRRGLAACTTSAAVAQHFGAPAGSVIENSARKPPTATGTHAFNDETEFYAAVFRASRGGVEPDSRLFLNAAPNTVGQEAVGQDGGFAVPPDFREAIVRKVAGEDSLLALTDLMTTSSNTVVVPYDEATPWQTTGGIQAQWEGEGGLKAQSKPDLDGRQLKTSKLYSFIPVTDELAGDAPMLGDWLSAKVPEVMTSRVNEAIVRGTGVGMPLGFLNSGALITVAPASGQAADTITFANVAAMHNRMPARSRRNAVWIVNDDADEQLQKLQAPGVAGYLPEGAMSTTPYATLFGRPVIPIEGAPLLGDAGDISFVDLSQYWSVIKTPGVRQDISIHVWFDYDLTAFRFVMRMGGQPWSNAPITRPNGSTRSPFVTLGAR